MLHVHFCCALLIVIMFTCTAKKFMSDSEKKSADIRDDIKGNGKFSIFCGHMSEKLKLKVHIEMCSPALT